MSKTIEEKARALAEPVLTEAGFSLWDVVFEKEGAMTYLRILFDRRIFTGGDYSSITDDECADITKPLNALMDKQDFICHVDILEVGSPGLTRRLRRPEHFEASIGKPLRVLKRGEKGKSNAFRGTLTAFDKEKNEFTLGINEEKIIFGIKNCQRINLDL